MPESLQTADDLAFLAPAGRQLLREWNDTRTDYGAPVCLHQLIEAQVDRAPEAVAVVCEGSSLTYAELDRRASRLAHRLLRLGMQPDSPVGICAERSLELMVGLLAILKAGGAYVPLDPEYPRDRLAYMVDDALAGLAAPLLLTQGRLLPALPATGARIVLLDETVEEPETRPRLRVDPDQIAYLIYTSGSTGRPKGVMNSHRGIFNRLLWMQETYRLDASDVVLQKTPASFDVSVWEFFWPLLTGARLVMARPGGHRDPAYLARVIQEEGVTTAHFVPSMLSLFLEAPEAGRCASLRRVVCSGEALSHELQQRFFSRLPCELHNLYGPTEAAVDVTYWACRRDGGPPVVPIGWPVANTRIHLLDADLRPAPAGDPGELHIGGIQLARGYWRRPELTAERFVPDPGAAEPGGRLYKTGDLARHRPDGSVEYLGRIDHQVKIRGVRIELGEIEATLEACPGVRDAVVVVKEAGPGDKRLVACFVAAAEAPSVAALRAHLRARLPEAMVPSYFAALPELPLTPNGKVDRKALTLRELPREEAAPAPAAAPRDPAEELLAGIWREVLGGVEAGVTDDFFDLGGHSLLLGQVLVRVRAVFGVDLPQRVAFEARTLGALARRIEEARRGPAELPPRPPLVRISRAEPPPLSFAQQRLWFLDRLQPGSPVYNLPVGWRLLGRLDPEALERALDEVFRRHEALRTTFAEGPDGEPRQIVAPFHPPGLPRVDLTALPAGVARKEAERQAARAARRPFDLARGPVARALLLRPGDAEHHLLFVCHHVAFDGWSVVVLQRELGALYGAFAAGRPSPLPEPEVQYADFAVWQRRWLSGEVVAAQLAYWRQRLAGAPALLELPADRPRPPAQSFRGASRALPFPPALAAGLRGLARDEGSTLFMTSLAVFSALLCRLTGQTDLVVGSPVAGRTEGGIEGLLGFFVNALALRADLTGDPSFRALLGRVRESALAAYAHQDLPFERLVEELHPERDLSRSPVFQVVLALDPARGGELTPGLRCEMLRVDTATAKFDLTLFLQEEAGGLKLVLEHATDLFDPATVARLGRAFCRLLSGLLETGTAARVSALPLLGETERWQILGEWHEPRWWAPTGAVVHELVAAQIARAPEAVALVYGRERITYRELGERAGRLSRRLAALGVGPETRVGVYLSRAPVLVTTLLGILGAGGAYVPLDPGYPRERLGFMLEDAGAPVIVTERALVPRLPASSARVVVIDEDLEGMAEAEPRRALPGNLAYLIYTSGSTGRPKAVAIEHHSTVDLIRWAQGTYDREELTGAVLAATSISFDVSVAELFFTLSSGGRLILADNVLQLPELPAAGEVHLVCAVPSAIAAMADARALPPGVKTVNLGGEPVKSALAEALHAGGVERVRNLYGPSEDTTYSTYEVIARGSRREPTIGRPVAGGWARLLDRELRPVPVGVLGEIYLGGAGLARGYLGRPELTADRYVPDPLASSPGERLYRTSDLGRYLPDGRLEYLGRLDHQVKVRGYRIELGEIEAALLAHPRVREAVVVALGESADDRFLAAYFVAAAPPPTAGELRDHLRARLIEPMVPASFTRLERFPLSPNGKVDRKALPAPESAEAEAAGPAAFRGPVDPLQELLAGIWAEVLGWDELPAAGDDFFALGGHSLLATRVVSRVRAALGVELPLRALFAAPTLGELAALVTEELGTAATAATAAAGSPVQPLADRADLPLSFAQQRLWLLDRLEPGATVYNIPLAYRIDGPLDVACLEAVLGEVARRHEALRATFAIAESGEPRLAVAPPRPFALPCVDISGLPAPAREDEAGRLSREEAARLFDLAAGPLFRTALLVTGRAGRGHRLLVSMHHIVSDGWSVEVFLGELSALYGAVAAGLPSPLPELAIQYADFAAWQRRWLAGPVLAAQLDHWRRQLAGAPEALDLPTDRPRPAVESSRGTHFSVALPPALAAGARALSRSRGATLFMTLLAGFATQLHRVTGEVDLLLGSPVANRNRTEIEGLLGFFVNTLVMRADLAGDPGFDTLIARVRETALAAYAHQDLPFERLVEELAPQRSLARSPLFQVSFVLGVEGAVYELAAGLPLVPLPVDYRTAKYDLTLAVDVLVDALTATFEYRTDLLDRATVTRWAGHFIHLLDAVIAAPEAPLSTFGLLSPAERHQLAREWNDTGSAAAPGEVCLHRLFEAQAARTPEAVAVVSADGSRRLSYRELDARAEALARRLRALGVGPETLVSVLMDRTVELVAALLAVLKAGGAYVPIDPHYPEERRNFLLADSGARVVVTRASLLPLLAEGAGGGVEPVCVDAPGADIADTADIADAAESPLPAAPSPPSERNLAYLIYTSGSTGRPKGVAIEHRGAVAFARWAWSVFPAADLAAVLASTSICFDLSVFELFVPLSCGGSVRVVENALALTGGGFAGLTLINTVPSAMAELLNAGAVPASVRTVNLAGEPLSRALADRIHALGTVGRVLNLYGPSEDTTYSTWTAVPRGGPAPTIGRPLAGTQAHLVDRRLAPVPLGIAGELVLAGEGLARGYHGRPELTAERFVPDPFATAPGGRLYRTGDLARFRGDGEIEFLGRLDHQVKVRGFRIELGEVEAALTSHPAVERALAATHAYGPDDVRLVAWVVPREGEPLEALETGALRAWLARRLPDYMIPAALVPLAALPLTPNGKVDRKALPSPTSLDRPTAAAVAEARSPLEDLVAGLWAELLGGALPGLHDDFFEQGGHSLLATRLLARLRAATGVDLPLRALFAHPTVAALAAAVERGLQASGAPALPPIEPAAAGDDAPASSAQERLWFFHQLDPGGSVLNVPHPLQLTGPLRPAALAAALTEIARRHASLRTSFVYGEGGLRQRIAPSALSAEMELPLADLGALPPAVRDAEARRLTREEARQPFDLAAPPLWRARLLRLGDEEHRLLLTFHHTITDGWSFDLLEGELAALYPACAAGDESPLPEPALQYADFAVWQRRWLTDEDSEALAPQLAYWRRQLAGVPTVLDLPADRPRPPRQSFRGEVLLLPLAADLSARVTALGRREGTTLLMTALAAFAALLGRYTGRADVVLGSPAANRHHAETEGLFGFFVGTLVLRLDLAGDPTFRELLRRARETALGAYAHPDVPFERLVEELDPARDKSRNPLVQVMLSVQPVPAGPFRFAGLAAEAIDVHTDTAQFDLSLFFLESPQGLTLEAEYSTDLFARSTVERMLAHLAALLAAVVADPDLRLSALPAEIAPRPRPATAIAAEKTLKPEPDDREARLAERRARLSAGQRSLLEQRLRTRAPQAEAAAAPSSLVAIQPAGPRPPFFCVHPAGGDVLCFQALSHHLGSDQPFHGLQSRGLGAGEEKLETIEAMAAAYRDEIVRAAPGPYHLGGWSLGGAVVYELARQLAAGGAEVALLAILDATPGPWPDAGPAIDEGDDVYWLMEIVDYLQRLWNLDLGLSAETLRALAPEERTRRFLAALQGTPFGAAASPEPLRRLLDVFKANVRAFRRYRPEPYPGPLILFRSADDETPADPTLGWGALSSRVEIETVPGDHVSALAEPHVRTLAARLRARIDQVAKE